MLQRLHSGEKLVRHTQYRFAELSKVGGCNETILGAQQENGLSHSQSVGFFFLQYAPVRRINTFFHVVFADVMTSPQVLT